MRDKAFVGAVDHSNWMALVTIAPDGSFLDRRRVELGEAGLPVHPHHHEGQGLPIDAAVLLVERVRAVAQRRAAEGLAELVSALTLEPAAIALRQHAPLPTTVAERIRDYRAQCFADSAMYRDALAAAARARGWDVDWFDPRSLDLEAMAGALGEAGKRAGRPWQKEHKVAMAAAWAAREKRSRQRR